MALLLLAPVAFGSVTAGSFQPVITELLCPSYVEAGKGFTCYMTITLECPTYLSVGLENEEGTAGHMKIVEGPGTVAMGWFSSDDPGSEWRLVAHAVAHYPSADPCGQAVSGSFRTAAPDPSATVSVVPSRTPTPPVLRTFSCPATVWKGPETDGRATCTARATDINADPVKYAFDFGDGGPPESVWGPAGYDVQWTHAYSAPGTYQVTMGIIDSTGRAGGFAERSVEVKLDDVPPLVYLWEPAPGSCMRGSPLAVGLFGLILPPDCDQGSLIAGPEFVIGEEMPLRATSADPWPGSGAASIVIYVDFEPVCSGVYTAECSWRPPGDTPGIYVFTVHAKATDAVGNVARSDTRFVTLVNPPSTS